MILNPIILHDNARIHTSLSWTSCTAGNGKYWNMQCTHPNVSPCDYDLLSKVKEPLRGTQYNTTDEIVGAIGRANRNINKDGCAGGVQRRPNIWQKVIYTGGGELYWRYINVVYLWIKPCQQYRTVGIAFYLILVFYFITRSVSNFVTVFVLLLFTNLYGWDNRISDSQEPRKTFWSRKFESRCLLIHLNLSNFNLNNEFDW